MTQAATTLELVHPRDRNLYVSPHKSKRYPKSFGTFFANNYLEDLKEYSEQYREVCYLNKWNFSHFITYTSMIRWLLNNNAGRTTIEAVLDTAYRHQLSLTATSNSDEESRYLFKYVQSKYDRGESFDYSKLPVHSEQYLEVEF